MTPKIDPAISTIVVVVGVVLTIGGLVAQRLALHRLRTRHPKRWAELLQPGESPDNPSRKQVILFMKSANQPELNDRAISAYILLARWAMLAVGTLLLLTSV
jgi:hypothetical protein